MRDMESQYRNTKNMVEIIEKLTFLISVHCLLFNYKMSYSLFIMVRIKNLRDSYKSYVLMLKKENNIRF